MLTWLNVMNRPEGAIHHSRRRELALSTDELNRTITQIGSRATPADQPQSLSVTRTPARRIPYRRIGTGKLPAYAPELNPVEPIWANLKRSLANLTKHDIHQLTALVKTRLRRMQYRPGLLEGFLAKPGLDLAPLQ